MKFMSLRICPDCGCKDLAYDSKHSELYCKDCGLVLSSPYNYVGGVKVDAPYSYDYYTECDRNIHFPTYITRDKKGWFRTSHCLTYNHNIPDSKLMKYGRKYY